MPNHEPILDDIERGQVDPKSIINDTNADGSARIDGIISSSNALREDNRLPKEKWKTFVAFLMLIVAFIISTATLSTVHDYVQNTEPLPDIILNNIKISNDTPLYVSEVMIIAVLYTSIGLVCLHKHRWIVGRRILFLLACLYLMRALTFAVTVLPIASRTYYCSPKSNNTSVATIAKRTIELITGFGLSINGKQVYCGDSIYSGHTVMLVLGYLIISECKLIIYSHNSSHVIIYFICFRFTKKILFITLARLVECTDRCCNDSYFTFSLHNRYYTSILCSNSNILVLSYTCQC